MEDKTLFQYCQKIVVFSKNREEVLLCKRKGEEDFDGIYSFPGGKMEVDDGSIEGGLRREKCEELGNKCNIKVYLDYIVNEFYVKKNGNSMILPHFFAIYEGGEIILNEEYSDFKWVKVEDLENFEPKIDTISGVVHKLLKVNGIYENSENILIV